MIKERVPLMLKRRVRVSKLIPYVLPSYKYIYSIKSSGCSSRGLRFKTQHPHGSSQLLTPVPGDPWHQACTWCTYMCTQAKYSCT